MSFMSELKRRNVLRIAIAYLAISWLLVQIVETLFPVFGLSNDLIRIVVIALAIGFPLVLIFSWLYELTPEGVKLDKDVDRASSDARQTVKKLDRAIIVVLALSLVYFAFDKFVLDPARDAEIAAASVKQGKEEALEKFYGQSSIAVLPFVNMSDDVDNEYFSDGIAEELLNLLSKVQNLKVISRSSSFTFRGLDLDIPTIGEQLSVAHVLVGSVRKAGNKIRITAQLIDAGSDTLLWSETYDRELEDVFAVQDEISAAIVSAVKGPLGLENHTAQQDIPTTNTDAHEAFLRGRYLVARRAKNNMENAVIEFEKAIALDPQFALAHAELALTHMLLGIRDFAEPADAISSAQPHVLRALALNPSLAESLAAAGLLSRVEHGYSEESIGYFEKAIQLNPNYSDAYNWLSQNYENFQPPRYQESFAAMDMAIQLDPLSEHALHNYVHRLIRRDRMAEADVVLEKLAPIAPRYHALMFAYRRSIAGEFAYAVTGPLDSLMIDPLQQFPRGSLRYYLAILGFDAEAIAINEAWTVSTLSILGRHREVVALLESELAENPTSEDAMGWLANFHPYAGIYEPAWPMWEDWWREDPENFGDHYDYAALIVMRRRFSDDPDVSDVLAVMKEKAQRLYDGGITAGGGADFRFGLALFMEGDHAGGIELMGKAVENGYPMRLGMAFLQPLFDHPDFAPILVTIEERKKRERHRLLSIVCNDNPYEEVWQPEPGTCEQFASEN